jgi:hypothetical protein
LDRVQRLLGALDNPQDKLAPVIHVAGTNGKGSTIAFLRACFEAAGLRVHVYTSPHLVRFAERIRIAGHLIGEDALTAVLEECERANDGAPITFFEITTAAALLACSRSGSAGGSTRPMSSRTRPLPRSRQSRSTISISSATPWPRSPSKRPGFLNLAYPP